eukprot:COSAG02_NODE_10189_length_1998_cov_11.032904_1_plen_226_part_00
MEIEALEAIFDEEFKPDSEQPETKFSVVINDLEFLSKEIVLDFKYPETYPDVPAEFDIQPTLQLTNDQKERVREAMAAAAEEEAGNAMVFAMVTAAKDWLTENFDADNEVEEKEKVVAPELTQEERGTPVTKENFIEWHAAFLAQMKAQGKWTEAAKQEGLTGRQLFEGGTCVDMPLQLPRACLLHADHQCTHCVHVSGSGSRYLTRLFCLWSCACLQAGRAATG